MPESQQERLLKTVLEFAVGAPFTFDPPAYRKGSATREPCDVAWVCNGVAVLANMTSSATDSADHMLRHNLDKLRGWLRVWQSGAQRLQGSSASMDFDVGFDEVTHHVLLSVVDGPNAFGETHSDWQSDKPQDARVALVLTLPEPVLSQMFRQGGGMHELVDLAEGMRRRGGRLSEADVHRMWSDAYRHAQRNELSRVRSEPQFRKAQARIRGLLNVAFERTHVPESGDAFEMLADIKMCEMMRLTADVSNEMFEMEVLPDGAFGKVAVQLFWDLGPYPVQMFLATAHSLDLDETWTRFSKHHELLRSKPRPWGALGIDILPMGPMGAMPITYVSRPRPSRLAHRLARLSTD